MQFGPAPKLHPVGPVVTKFRSITPTRMSMMGATQTDGSVMTSSISAFPVTALSGKFPVLATSSLVGSPATVF